VKLTAYVENQTTPGWRNRLQALLSGSRDPDCVAFGCTEVDSYFTLDWISTIDVGTGEIQIAVENLLNEEYLPIVSQISGSNSQAAARGTRLSINYSLSW